MNDDDVMEMVMWTMTRLKQRETMKRKEIKTGVMDVLA
jgi:hypothetical protein